MTPDSRPELDDALVARFERGETSAVSRVSVMVARVVSRHAGGVPASDREDVSQATLADLCELLRTPGRAAVCDLEALARSVAYRRCIDRQRRRRREVELASEVRSREPPLDAALIASEKRQLARRVLEELPSGCRELLLLYGGQQLGYREIARRLGRSEGALRTQMYSCLKQARQIASRLSGGEKERE